MLKKFIRCTHISLRYIIKTEALIILKVYQKINQVIISKIYHILFFNNQRLVQNNSINYKIKHVRFTCFTYLHPIINENNKIKPLRCFINLHVLINETV